MMWMRRDRHGDDIAWALKIREDKSKDDRVGFAWRLIESQSGS